MLTVAGANMLDRGLAAQKAGRADDAIDAYRRAIRINPGLAPAQFNLGQLLLAREEYGGAARAFAAAARLRPTAADAWLNLGASLERLGRYQEAVAAYDQAVECAPEDVRGYFNRGNALLAQGEFTPATEAFKQAIERQPGHVDSEWNLATALLASGQLEAGWAQYEWRWAKRGLDPSRGLRFPLWSGEPLAGKRLLVWREQGLGDEILFATCVRDLVAAGADLTLALTPRLVSLFTRSLPGVRVIDDQAWGDESFDYHLPLGALPRYLRPNLHAFPCGDRLLVPDSARASRWADRLAKLGPGATVGICWRSGLITAERGRQYAPIEAWGPLFEVPGIHWINLQYDECADEIHEAEARFGVTIRRWPRENLRDDLESVAALLWNLNLVVTAPTVVGSLAGAVGTRCWEIDAGGDWTSFGEAVSPWFSSLRHVRRPWNAEGWEIPLECVARDLRGMAETEQVPA